ncbi:MAG: chromosome segregation protein SMC [Phycisphaerales bacterium]|nr:MAG: chromosome segregation protein SMC [Phycisphaerales bacterium]
MPGLWGNHEAQRVFLKRISMSGFKSFADRVHLTFGPGVTCIVGPNGCGKSNVVDSFKWVLGEQSAKSLRGRQMMDMIFAGCATRRAASVAQVDLLFDNADRALPLDRDEITVTRKLYRSGESDYLLNHEPARLKDIRELFMDTGVGTEAYSVIEQGRVERLVQSNPVDRRVIFEEAAGISKYKARRKEAQRKLERTEQNLLRVADIIEEVEKRLRSVKLQAGKARSFQEYDRRLRELQSTRSMAEYHRLAAGIQENAARQTQLSDAVTELHARISRFEADQAELATREDGLNAEIAAADNGLVRAQAAIGHTHERIESARRRIEEQQALLARATQQLEADTQRIATVRNDLDGAERNVTHLQQQSDILHARVDENLEEDRQLARELTRIQAALEDEKAGIVELLRQTAQAHNEVTRLNTHRESLLHQKGRLSQRVAKISEELRGWFDQKSAAIEQLREIERLVNAEEEKLEAKRAEAARIDRVRAELADHLASAREARSAMASRQDVLRSLDVKMDGVGQGARSLLEARQSADEGSPLSAIRGLVADFFETDIEHAAVIEAALGDADQYLVVDDGLALFHDPRLHEGLAGRVTVLALDHLPPLINVRSFADQPGFIAHAVDWVRTPEDMTQLGRHLLGKTVVVRTLADALRMMRDDLYNHRFVTLDGQIVEPDGRVSVGPAASTAGLISRKSELRDLAVRLEEVDERITTLADQLNRTQAEADHVLEVQQQLRSSIHAAQTSAVEARAGLQSIEESIRRLSSERPLIESEVAMLERQMDEALARSAERRAALEGMERENADREAAVQRLQDRIDQTVEKRQACQSRLTEMRVELGQLGEKRRTMTERVAQLRTAAGELEEAVQGWRRDLEQCQLRIADSQRQIVEGDAELHRLEAESARLEALGAELRRRRELMRLELETLSESVKTARNDLQDTETSLHQVQMALAEAKVRRDDLVARTLDELGVDLVAQYESYEYAEADWAAVEAEIAELRQKIQRLGNVNLDAIAELEELEQRDAFLTGQRDDLTESAHQLQQLIEKLNAESQQRFQETFDQIREHFRGLFRRLFGGGKADIVLENPEDVLESGVEIVAQPPGKELQSISLMSGGEKSMTAIAMMMSIFKSRPSPFAILDEVDAALDEANNERFNQIVREFVEHSQFIVITHSRRTMTIADHLYGITMQEPGISTLVSVQLESMAEVA